MQQDQEQRQRATTMGESSLMNRATARDQERGELMGQLSNSGVQREPGADVPSEAKLSWEIAGNHVKPGNWGMNGTPESCPSRRPPEMDGHRHPRELESYLQRMDPRMVLDGIGR